MITVKEYQEEEEQEEEPTPPKSSKSKASIQMVRTPPTPHSLTTPEFRELTPRPRSPGIISSNDTIKVEDLEDEQSIHEVEEKEVQTEQVEVMHVQSEMLPKNENDMKMEDVESGLSIRDEDDQGSVQGDIEMGDMDAFVITKDALVTFKQFHKNLFLQLVFCITFSFLD